MAKSQSSTTHDCRLKQKESTANSNWLCYVNLFPCRAMWDDCGSMSSTRRTADNCKISEKNERGEHTITWYVELTVSSSDRQTDRRMHIMNNHRLFVFLPWKKLHLGCDRGRHRWNYKRQRWWRRRERRRTKMNEEKLYNSAAKKSML